jgi:hypothetical protein
MAVIISLPACRRPAPRDFTVCIALACLGLSSMGCLWPDAGEYHGGASGGGGEGGGGEGGSQNANDANTGGGESVVTERGLTVDAGGCTFTLGSTLAKVPTVGVVTWSTDLTNMKSAKIDFGLDANYGMTAPVNAPAAAGADNTTLLLGMKPNRTYNYRITVTGESGECASRNHTITTGPQITGLAKVKLNSGGAYTPAFGGFLITGQYMQLPNGRKSPAFIVDKDGDIVWAVAVSTDVTGARMSYQGSHVWINAANVPGKNNQSVHRVSMTGEDEDLSDRFPGLNHQLTVLPDETVAFYAYGLNNCEDIKEYNPATQAVRTIVNSGVAQGGASQCHVNNIQYSAADDTLVFSDMDSQAVVKVRRSDGKTLWIANGAKTTFTGDAWLGGQHGIHLLGLDRFLLFNNNSRVLAGSMGTAGGDGTGSIAAEYRLDLAGKTITRIWAYRSDIQNDVMGDVQRMDNGNTIMAFSTKGVIQEVNADGVLVQEWVFQGSTSTIGYIEKRASLYGPPPR